MMDRRTDRLEQTDGQTSCDGIVRALRWHSPCKAYALHGKNDDCRPISRFILDMVQKRVIVTMEGE